MAIKRYYILTASEGNEAALQTALVSLSEIVRPLNGCEGIELLSDLGNSKRFIFIETWSSADAQKESGASIPKSAFGPIMAALDGPPDASFFETLIEN
ncbi:antibiotic biosynthesis monooxygenase [Sphingobium phenoxybenzoativorans]|uniref:Antibiotic biosynthesis monooxygenase n=1 Tax=Sphingobium phenoxybenzoativorans TaxID=1592790 RepID=A0A975KAJ9_9SPHN|nr:antibiotic biosynthesis monooxygenase family protein [Sphingobium phenoxybenzoativorans]QUT07830.1 antibiotic biosynthesis monooxygenase [Sphingobium phenoxybenzoativorans]